MKKLVAVVSVAVLAASFSAVRVIPAHAQFPGRDGRIVFVGCDDVNCQLYTVNPDGTALQRVTHDSAFDFVPDWSPDGTRIVYSHNMGQDGSRNHLHIINADGTHHHRLTTESVNRGELWPHFRPSGHRIVFTQFFDDGGISSIRPNGTDKRVIVSAHTNGESYNQAIPSPQGGRLAFTLYGRGGVLVGVYVSKADGTDQRRVSPPRLEGSSPDWSPQGGRLVFTTNTARPNSAIYAVNPNATDLDGLTHPAFPNNDYGAAYSPSGDRLVFESDRRYPDLCCSDLFTMRANGSDVRRIPLPSSISFAGDPRWGTAPLLSGSTDPASASLHSPRRAFRCSELPSSVRPAIGGSCSRPAKR